MLAVPAALVAVLGAEVLIARQGTNLPEGSPLVLDGVFDRARPGAVQRVVWLGDSTAAGVGASRAGAALPRVVAQRLDQPVHLTVLAVSGARIGDVLDEQVPRLPPGPIDLVFLSVGANDTVHLTRDGDFEARYRRVLHALPDGVAVVMLGVPDMGSTVRFAQPLRFVAGVQEGVWPDIARRGSVFDPLRLSSAGLGEGARRPRYCGLRLFGDGFKTVRLDVPPANR